MGKKKKDGINLTHVYLKKGERLGGGKTVTRPKKAIKVIAKEVKKFSREAMYVICLDAECHVINICKVADGGRSNVYFEIRDIFLSAMISNAHSIILIHNHIADNPVVSEDDIQATERILGISNELGIPLADHLVVAQNTGKYVSILNFMELRDEIANKMDSQEK